MRRPTAAVRAEHAARARRVLALAAPAAVAWSVLATQPATAHGVQGRPNTPIPLSDFLLGAGAVVAVSFVVLALGWGRSRLTADVWRPVPGWLCRLALSRPLTVAARAVTLAAFALVFAAAAFGSTRIGSNLAPVSVFVVWWAGLVPLSVVFGNVWRAINPWATVARALSLGGPNHRELPPWVGVWPATVLLCAYAWFELIYPTQASPRLLAVLIALYSALTLAGMARYGVERWLDHGEVFSVYTGLLATLSPVEVRAGRLGFRPPVVGAARLRWRPAQVAFVGVLIATVVFDGLSGSDLWAERDVAAGERLIDLGLDPSVAGLVVGTIGMLATLAFFLGVYELLGRLSALLAGWSLIRRAREAPAAFVHSLIPIALAYFVAHYFTLFVFQSQDLIRLASDPFGTGADLFGTAGHEVDFRLVSAGTIWVVQLGAIVGGHVLALALAHERALTLSKTRLQVVVSQVPMLVLMVVLTVGGLWSLSEGMATV